MSNFTQNNRVFKECVILGACLVLIAALRVPLTSAIQIDQDALTPPVGAQSAANDGLETLKECEPGVDVDANELGFRCLDEQAKAQLHDPLPVFVLSPVSLSGFQGNPADLLRQVNLFMYPITLGGEVRSSVMVERSRTDPAQWRAVSFGGARLIALIDKYRKDSKANVVVWIVGLNRHFLGRLRANEFQLIPLVDDPSLEFTAGTALPADKAFTKLKSVAAAYYEAVRNRRPGDSRQEKQGGAK